MSTIPTKAEDLDGDNSWYSQHTRFVMQSKEREPDVVFIGDSIIQQLQFTESWRRYIEPLHALNFGIYNDATQHVLWRLEDGELDGISPKAIVLCVGSHNRGHSADEITDGIVAVVDNIRKKQPQASLIVLGLLPCGRDDNPKRQRHHRVNQLLQERLCRRLSYCAATTTASLSADGDNDLTSKNFCGIVTFLCPDWEQLVQPNGSVSHRDLYDYMHLTEQGFSKILEPLLEELQNCLHTFLKTGTPNDVVETL